MASLGREPASRTRVRKLFRWSCVLVIGIPFGLSVGTADNVEDGIVLCGTAYGNTQAVCQKGMRAVQFFDEDAVLFEGVKQ